MWSYRWFHSILLSHVVHCFHSRARWLEFGRFLWWDALNAWLYLFLKDNKSLEASFIVHLPISCLLTGHGINFRKLFQFIIMPLGIVLLNFSGIREYTKKKDQWTFKEWKLGDFTFAFFLNATVFSFRNVIIHENCRMERKYRSTEIGLPLGLFISLHLLYPMSSFCMPLLAEAALRMHFPLYQNPFSWLLSLKQVVEVEKLLCFIVSVKFTATLFSSFITLRNAVPLFLIWISGVALFFFFCFFHNEPSAWYMILLVSKVIDVFASTFMPLKSSHNKFINMKIEGLYKKITDYILSWNHSSSTRKVFNY